MSTAKLETPSPGAADSDLESGTLFTPRFGADGLLPAVATCARTGEVLMLAYMNAEALARTIETGEAHYWSRSRGRLWRKGEVSGNTQRVVELRVDCDQDAIWLRVEMGGGGSCCHTGHRSCFYRAVATEPQGPVLRFVTADSPLDPENVYGRAEAQKEP